METCCALKARTFKLQKLVTFALGNVYGPSLKYELRQRLKKVQPSIIKGRYLRQQRTWTWTRTCHSLKTPAQMNIQGKYINNKGNGSDVFNTLFLKYVSILITILFLGTSIS